MLSFRKRRVPINASLLLASRSVGAFEGRDDGAHQKYRQQEISKSAYVYSDTQLPDSEDIVNTDHDIVLNRKDQASPVAQSSLENSSSHSSSESNGNDEFPVHGRSPNLKLSSSDSETASPSLRKKSLSLPTVHLPAELQTALDNAMSSECAVLCVCFIAIVWPMLASSPGPLRRRRKGLVHTVCACSVIPRILGAWIL